MALRDYLLRRKADATPRWVRLARMEFARVNGQSLDSVGERLRTRVLVKALDAEPLGDDAVNEAVREYAAALYGRRG